MFGLPIFLIKPLLCVLAAAAAAFVLHQLWTGVKVHIAAPYVAAQIAKDQVRITAAEANVAKANDNARRADDEAKNARADTAECQSKAAEQSKAVKESRERADAAQAATRAIIAAAKQESAAKESRIKHWQEIAAAPPKKDMACADELARARTILQDTLRQRRGIPPPVVPGAK